MKIAINLTFFLILCLSIVNAQTQIGNDIETTFILFDKAISLSEDGSRIAIGDPYLSNEDEEVVRIYEYTNDEWVQLGNDITFFRAMVLVQKYLFPEMETGLL